MGKKVFSLLLCVALIGTAFIAVAGGPPAPPRPYGQPCAQPGPQGPQCAYWGDAPFPGMCGGVVALPFLVVGSLLGGNPTGPCGAPPAPQYGCAQPPAPPVQGYAAVPPPYPPARPPYAAATPPAGYYANPAQAGLLAGVPGIGLCTDLISSVTGGAGILY